MIDVERLSVPMSRSQGLTFAVNTDMFLHTRDLKKSAISGSEAPGSGSIYIKETDSDPLHETIACGPATSPTAFVGVSDLKAHCVVCGTRNQRLSTTKTTVKRFISNPWVHMDVYHIVPFKSMCSSEGPQQRCTNTSWFVAVAFQHASKKMNPETCLNSVFKSDLVGAPLARIVRDALLHCGEYIYGESM